MPTLALKLAVDSYFGAKVMAQCTVMASTAYKGLPINELNSLKQFLFSKIVKYRSSALPIKGSALPGSALRGVNFILTHTVYNQ